jgi:lysosomal acid phosphatase
MASPRYAAVVMTVCIILLSVLCALPCLGLDPDLKGLKLVHIVYRHGERTPIDIFPTDPHKDDWPVGLGQLTSRGKATHFQLGQWLRSRYDGFLSSNYTEEEIYVRSTDVDRTLMSAQANLAGLFPPHGYWKWNKNLDWQPIPIHTVPQVEDYLLSSHANCPRFSQLHEEVLHGDFMTSIYKENEELFQSITTNTGSHFNITDIVHLDYIYDTLLIESIFNKTLPEWTKNIFPGGKFEELRDLSFTVDTFNHELKRLKGGPFVKEVVEHFDQFESNTLDPPNRKMFMYSGHDTTVAPILHTLGVFDIKAPPFASTVIIELFDRSGLFVQVSYKNTTDLPPTILTLPGCEALCPLSMFKELTESVRPVDVKVECGVTNGVDPSVQKVILLAAVASVCLALTVTLAVLVMLCRRKEEGTGYQRVQQVDLD